MKQLSLSAYAKHRRAGRLPGGTLSAVQAALKAGRIQKTAEGLIDMEIADRAWVRKHRSVQTAIAAGGR